MGNSKSAAFGRRTNRGPVYCDAACLRRVCQEITPPGRKNRVLFKGVPNHQFQGLMIPQNHYDEVYSKILLGDNTLPRHPKECKELGITHILNAAQGNKFGQVDTNESLYTPYGLYFYGIEAQDNEKFNLASHFYKGADFIESALSGGGKILVHCVQGISRSATIVCAFLMIKKGMTAEHAMKSVRSKREIFPNQGFLRQLCELNDRIQAEKLIEKSLSRTPSICSDLLKHNSQSDSPVKKTKGTSKISQHYSFFLKGSSTTSPGKKQGFILRRYSSQKSKRSKDNEFKTENSDLHLRTEEKMLPARSFTSSVVHQLTNSCGIEELDQSPSLPNISVQNPAQIKLEYPPTQEHINPKSSNSHIETSNSQIEIDDLKHVAIIHNLTTSEEDSRNLASHFQCAASINDPSNLVIGSEKSSNLKKESDSAAVNFSQSENSDNGQ